MSTLSTPIENNKKYLILGGSIIALLAVVANYLLGFYAFMVFVVGFISVIGLAIFLKQKAIAVKAIGLVIFALGLILLLTSSIWLARLIS